MDFFKLVLQSPGWIFGPLMLIAGLVAIVMCVRAMSRDRSAARRALLWSLLPVVFGVVGAITGGIVWMATGQVAPAPTMVWMALGGTILFGVFVAIIPTLWSIILLQRRPPVLA